MYILKRDQTKCGDCNDECNKAFPGFSYREHGLFISSNNLTLHEPEIANAMKLCKNNAIKLEMILK